MKSNPRHYLSISLKVILYLSASFMLLLPLHWLYAGWNYQKQRKEYYQELAALKVELESISIRAKLLHNHSTILVAKVTDKEVDKVAMKPAAVQFSKDLVNIKEEARLLRLRDAAVDQSYAALQEAKEDLDKYGRVLMLIEIVTGAILVICLFCLRAVRIDRRN